MAASASITTLMASSRKWARRGSPKASCPIQLVFEPSSAQILNGRPVNPGREPALKSNEGEVSTKIWTLEGSNTGCVGQDALGLPLLAHFRMLVKPWRHYGGQGGHNQDLSPESLVEKNFDRFFLTCNCEHKYCSNEMQLGRYTPNWF